MYLKPGADLGGWADWNNSFYTLMLKLKRESKLSWGALSRTTKLGAFSFSPICKFLQLITPWQTSSYTTLRNPRCTIKRTLLWRERGISEEKELKIVSNWIEASWLFSFFCRRFKLLISFSSERYHTPWNQTEKSIVDAIIFAKIT